jgi:hypothetical protein
MIGFTQTTPDKITPRIQQFCKGITKRRPIYVPVFPKMPEMRCHLNARDFCSAIDGAQIIYGWVIWESEFILEAEFHSIIKYKDDLFCVTTPPDGEEALLFLPDPERKIKMVDNVLETWNNIVYPSLTPTARVIRIPQHIAKPILIEEKK